MSGKENGVNGEKKNAAEYIFSEIGLIDDKIIADACPTERVFAYREQVTGKRTFPRVLAAAAAAVLIIAAVPFSVFIGNRLSKGDKDEQTTAPIGTENLVQPKSIDEVLISAAALRSAVQRDEVNLFDGKMKIVWNIAGTEEFYTAELDGEKAGILNSATVKLMTDPENAAGDKSPAAYVWICDGKGNVFSPMLKYAKGNIGYGRLYSYEPEIEVTEEYASLIYDLISR